jgi:DNA-binding NarL/FixJ family response regulator
MSSQQTEAEMSPGSAAEAARPSPSPAPIRVVVAESSEAIREYLAATLAREQAIELVTACSDCEELDLAMASDEIDVLITDVRLRPSPGDEGIRVANRLRERNPQIGVVLLGHYAEPVYVLSVLEGGSARAYLLIERLSEKGELLHAIESVAAGYLVVDPAIVESLIEARARAARSPLPRLDRQERELLALVVEGRRDAAIAGSLGIPEPSVATRVGLVFDKLGLQGSLDANSRAREALGYLAEEGR